MRVDIMQVDSVRIRGYGYADTDTQIQIRGYEYADTDTRIRIRRYGYQFFTFGNARGLEI